MLKTAHMEISLANINMLLASESLLYKCQTYAFTVLGVSQLFHALGMRNTEMSLLKMKWKENLLMIGAFVFGLSLQVLVTEVPYFIKVFGTSHLTLEEWGILLGLAAMPAVAHELMALFGGRK